MSERAPRSLDIRPTCCPEPRCEPLHLLRDADATPGDPGESFVCFGRAPEITFVYDGVEHRNDTRSCHYSPLKGVVAFQENADDWEALRAGYGRALARLRVVYPPAAHPGGDTTGAKEAQHG